MKSLLIITTCNQVEYTKKVDLSIPEINELDVVYIDDNSVDDTIEYLKSVGRNVITKTNDMGLTDSWNIGYRLFKEGNYDSIFISNNDVILNKTSLINMIKALEQFTVVCPLSSKRGAGHNSKFQDIGKYYPELSKISDNDKEQQIIESRLRNNSVVEMDRWNGFFFGLNRNIIDCEFDENNLFNPRNIQASQEGDLSKRMKEKPVVCCNSFIFHYKSVTAPACGVLNGVDKRNLKENINKYHRR